MDVSKDKITAKIENIDIELTFNPESCCYESGTGYYINMWKDFCWSLHPNTKALRPHRFKYESKKSPTV